MKRILIVDDNPDVTEIFAQLIEMMGHDPVTARDVAEGLTLAASVQPGLVLCDLGLPGNGLEFARACKRDDTLKNIKLIAISGRDESEDRRAALAAGFDDLLCKPVDFSTLQALCESVQG